MNNLPYDNVAFFDVDETLIMYKQQDPSRMVEIRVPGNPYSVHVTPHEEHIARLIHHKVWNNGVVVWSRSGYQWAEAVVKALDLEQYVDIVMSKPLYYYDDRPCCEILGEHRYLPFNKDED